MTIAPTPKRYGTWYSPITVDMLAQQVIGFENLLVDPKTSQLYHLERRPNEGRTVIVATSAARDAIGQGYNPRSVVNTYGGAPATVSNGVIFFTNFPDFRIYRVEDSRATPVTPPDIPNRFGALDVYPMNPDICVSVLEDVTDPDPSRVVNSLVAINHRTGAMTVIAKGCDFYAAPTFSPDGKKLAWNQWSHPNMPWQSAQIAVADVRCKDNSITLVNELIVAGKDGKTSSQQPRWLTNDTLLFIHDVAGWSQPWIFKADKTISPVLKAVLPEEFAEPLVLMGLSTYAVLDSEHVLFASLKNGFAQLHLVSPASGHRETINSPFVVIKQLRGINGTSAVFLGTRTDKEESIVKFERTSTGYRFRTLLSSTATPAPPHIISEPKPIVIHDERGPLHAVYYPPKNDHYVGLPGEKPPVIIGAHPGPTWRTPPGFALSRLLYTSRGFAWADVAFRGSTGYGREYTDKLNGNWGILDAEDCMKIAKHMASEGLADINRIMITGGAGGAYTVLQSLIRYPDFYAGGASHVSVADLKRAHEHFEKFQRFYTPTLLGGTPEEIPDVWRARSPVYNAGKIRSPLLLTHGVLDPIIPIEQARIILDAVRAAGGRVDYLFFEDEGHGYRKAANIKRQMAKELHFFSSVLRLAD